MDLDEATLTRAFVPGILATGLDAYSLRAWGYAANLPPGAFAGSDLAADFTLVGGRLTQGRAGSFTSSPVYSPYLDGLSVQGVEIYAHGVNTAGINAAGAEGHVEVIGSTLRSDVLNVTDRMDLLAAVDVRRTRGRIRIEGNHILDFPQVGIIAASSPDDESFTSIRDNRSGPAPWSPTATG